MNQRTAACVVAMAGSIALGTNHARAWHVETRFALRPAPGIPVIPLDGGVLITTPGTTNRIHVQLGVFDDANGAVPAQGLWGWADGTINGGGTNSAWHGPVSPLTYPVQGPFGTQQPLALDRINVAVGPRYPLWLGVPGGGPGDYGDPPPSPGSSGINSFVSVFFVDSIAAATDYTVTAAGYGGTFENWFVPFQPIPPEPGPDGVFGPGDANGDGINDQFDDTAGSIGYHPHPSGFVLDERFSHSLQIIVPTPSTSIIIPTITALALMRRRPNPKGQVA